MLLLLVVCIISTLNSEARPVHDYMFSVTGVVTAEDATPLQDAHVTLEVDGPVYDGVTPVKIVKHVTNETGGFVFMYISHKRSMKYTLTVGKEGFESQTVSGQAPPAGNHTIRLKRASGARLRFWGEVVILNAFSRAGRLVDRGEKPRHKKITGILS
jgi:hypothetical protein